MKKISQVSKMLFRKQEKYYICDPNKNVKCSKYSCWNISKGPCKCTMKRKYAKLGPDGEPIIAKDEDLYNLEWMEKDLI